MPGVEDYTTPEGFMVAKKQRKLRTAFTGFLLLLHLFAGMGMAQGAVICIAPGGHFAVETPHPDTGCVGSQKDFRPLGSTLDSSTSRGCWDTTIFAAGSNLALPQSVEIVSSAPQHVAVLSPATVVTFPARSLLTHVTSHRLRSTHDSLRSVVLLI